MRMSDRSRTHQQSMFYAAAFPARTRAVPPGERAFMAKRPASGGKWPVSFAYYDPATSLWKTSRSSEAEDLETFSETWPRSGMTRSGTAFRLRPLAPPISVTGSCLWPTPTATDWKDRLSSHRGANLLQPAVGGKVNPLFVEWLMGFPAEWTVLDASAMRLCRKSRSGSAAKS